MMQASSDGRQTFLLRAEQVGFLLNISALKSLFRIRLERAGLDAEAIELAVVERGKFWRLRVITAALLLGGGGYLLRDHFAIGSWLMYSALLIIAVQLHSRWLPSPGQNMGELLKRKIASRNTES